MRSLALEDIHIKITFTKENLKDDGTVVFVWQKSTLMYLLSFVFHLLLVNGKSCQV